MPVEDVVLGVWHEAQDLAGGVAEAGDVAARAVGVGGVVGGALGAVSQGDEAGGFELVEAGLVGPDAPFGVGDGAAKGVETLDKERLGLGLGLELGPAGFEAP